MTWWVLQAITTYPQSPLLATLRSPSLRRRAGAAAAPTSAPSQARALASHQMRPANGDDNRLPCRLETLTRLLLLTPHATALPSYAGAPPRLARLAIILKDPKHSRFHVKTFDHARIYHHVVFQELLDVLSAPLSSNTVHCASTPLCNHQSISRSSGTRTLPAHIGPAAFQLGNSTVDACEPASAAAATILGTAQTMDALPDASPEPGLSPSGSVSPSSPVVTASSSDGSKQASDKRGRGRPRKWPKIDPNIAINSSNKRSKTGCATCRRRKKKCDEGKPFCDNCRKTNHVCPGYASPDTLLRKDNRSEGTVSPPRSSMTVLSSRSSSPSFAFRRPGPTKDEDMDRMLEEHFFTIKSILYPSDGVENPWVDIMWPMAQRHEALMHSLLCLSGTHLALFQPLPDVLRRQQYHYDRSLEHLRVNNAFARHSCDAPHHAVADPDVAQALVLCMRSILSGEAEGQYRLHMTAAKHLVECQTTLDSSLQHFLCKFLTFCNVSSSLTSLTPTAPPALSLNVPPFIQVEAGRFFGVLSGIFTLFSRAYKIRNQVRLRRQMRLLPHIDANIRKDVDNMDEEVRDWLNSGIDSDLRNERYVLSLLYVQCVRVYLYRTIGAEVSEDTLNKAVDIGQNYLSRVLWNENVQSMLMTPVFLLGCASSTPVQRRSIIAACDRLASIRGEKSIHNVRRVTNYIWKMIDDQEDEGWDWEAAMAKLGLDFIVI